MTSTAFANALPGNPRIAVFRALQLGDMLCAVPALRALRAAFPRASITLIGLPWALEFAQRFDRYCDDFIAFPGLPGFPEQTPDLKALPHFLRSARAMQFDLALQLHGSGELSNLVTIQLRAQHVLGFRPAANRHEYPNTAHAHYIPWPESTPEVLRLLHLTDALGVPRQGVHLELPLYGAELQAWKALSAHHGFTPQDYVCLHPGARLPSRRWPLERFAAVACALLETNRRVVITGAQSESFITAALLHLIRQKLGPAIAQFSERVVDLTGRTSLGTLTALIAHSRMLICNDTGVSHIAAAVQTPSVVIASGNETARWAPLDCRLHHVLSFDVPCRPCSYGVCPIGHPCALGVTVNRVLHEAETLLKARLQAPHVTGEMSHA